MATFKKPTAIVLDIEGTTTDIGFVSRTLFPFIKQNISNYLNESFSRPETKELIERLRESSKGQKDLPHVADSDESKSEVVRTATEYALANIKEKRRISEIKQLQILIWVWGYEKALLKGHVFDEVSTRMHIWKHKEGIALYVFSSGMIAAQQLLLCCTNHGNLLPLVSDFFDSSMGEKTDPQSFRNISAKIGHSLRNVLFITDSPAEAIAARDAKCMTAIIRRSERVKPKGLDKATDIAVIKTFDDIQFK